MIARFLHFMTRSTVLTLGQMGNVNGIIAIPRSLIKKFKAVKVKIQYNKIKFKEAFK